MQARGAEPEASTTISARSLDQTRPLPTPPVASSPPDAYGARLEAAIACLARATGVPADRELARLREARGLLGVASEVSAVLGTLGGSGATARAVLAGVLPAVPVLYELVAVYRGSALARFGYLTYGPVRPSLARATGEILRGALALVARGGALDDARLLSRVFRLAHPRPSELDRRSALAGVLLAGVATGQGGPVVKAYLRAPFGSRDGHQGRAEHDPRGALEAIQGLVGLDALAAHDALVRAGGSFQGLGLDLGAGAAGRRLKVYARLPLAALAVALERLRSTVGGDPLALERLVESLEGPWLASVVELALALRPGARPTLKATAFLDEPRAAGAALGALSRLLASRGHPGGALPELLAAVTGSLERDAWARAIHGAGVELGAGEPKLSLYLRPPV